MQNVVFGFFADIELSRRSAVFERPPFVSLERAKAGVLSRMGSTFVAPLRAAMGAQTQRSIRWVDRFAARFNVVMTRARDGCFSGKDGLPIAIVLRMAKGY